MFKEKRNLIKLCLSFVIMFSLIFNSSIIPLPIDRYIKATEAVGLNDVPETAPLEMTEEAPPTSEMTDMNSLEGEEIVADSMEKESPIIEEVEDLRETSVKHFRKDDGTLVAEIYPYAVHYDANKNEEEGAKDPLARATALETENEIKKLAEFNIPEEAKDAIPDDKPALEIHPESVPLPDDYVAKDYESTENKPVMKEINNNLIDGTDGEIKEGVLKNTENALNVSFAKNASDEKLLKVKDGKFGFSFRLFEPGFTSSDILENHETESDQKIEAEVPALLSITNWTYTKKVDRKK
ncbi:hypothetical protein AZF37_07250 [endosymbiont 'TC1' of Trimyema compressum]|uniref:hypothetical protein n=1 Tax=endosymbiont 'TC1' of Trimyema compressum TaxID=243899 RepID=UPI0007F0BE13|nr:hypothetical protein [endosymbiont 'TC1' of Trimyema compressum]AMP20983.1 hypothetical protein AZF37_07250 [endosymbiont 'TC1' of Trimyema compressum]